MIREQNHPTRLGKSGGLWWLFPILMAWAICFQPSGLPLAAQSAPAEQEIAQPAVEEKPSAKEQTPAQEPQPASEQDEAQKPAEEPAKEDAEEDSKKDAQKAEEKPVAEEKQPAKEPESKDTEEKEAAAPASETKQESQPENKAETSDSPIAPAEEQKAMKPTAEAEANNQQPAQPTVEEERPVEVDPPQGKAETKPKPPEPPKDPKPSKKKKCIIGATATLLEKQSELKFRARIDSGAKSCSLHVEKVIIENESKKENISERMTENIGKVIHFEVKNGDNKTHILSSKIAGYVIIKTSNKKEGKRRYKVPLTFLWKNVEKEVLVTLNDRRHMDYPLLIGRNFLRGDFLVDVELDSDD